MKHKPEFISDLGDLNWTKSDGTQKLFPRFGVWVKIHDSQEVIEVSHDLKTLTDKYGDLPVVKIVRGMNR